MHGLFVCLLLYSMSEVNIVTTLSFRHRHVPLISVRAIRANIVVSFHRWCSMVKLGCVLLAERARQILAATLTTSDQITFQRSESTSLVSALLSRLLIQRCAGAGNV
jgi:hypothetical protein